MFAPCRGSPFLETTLKVLPDNLVKRRLLRPAWITAGQSHLLRAAQVLQ